MLRNLHYSGFLLVLPLFFLLQVTAFSKTDEDAISIQPSVVLSIFERPVTAVTFNPNTTAFVAGSLDGRLKLYEIDSKMESGNGLVFQREIETKSSSPISSVVFNGWGLSLIASTDKSPNSNGPKPNEDGGKLFAWDVSNNYSGFSNLPSFSQSSGIKQAFFSPITGNWLASLGESEIKIGGVDPTVDKTSSLYSLKDGANHFLTSVISSDNSLLFSGTREGWINEWNLQSPTLDSDRPFRFTSPKPLAIKNVGSLAVSRDGTFLVAAGEEVNQRKSWLGLWDIRKKKWLKPISSPHQSTIVGLHFLLDLKVIISVGSQGKAYIWNLDLSGQKSIRKLEIKSRAGIKDSTVICSALSSNGKYLVLGFKSGEIAVWNLKDIK